MSCEFRFPNAGPNEVNEYRATLRNLTNGDSPVFYIKGNDIVNVSSMGSGAFRSDIAKIDTYIPNICVFRRTYSAPMTPGVGRELMRTFETLEEDESGNLCPAKDTTFDQHDSKNKLQHVPVPEYRELMHFLNSLKPEDKIGRAMEEI